MSVHPLAYAVLSALLVACSSGDIQRDASPAAGSGGTAGTQNRGGGGAAGQTSSSGSPSTQPSVPSSVSDEDASTPDVGMGCAKAEYEATLRPLDLVVLLDQSGSMTEDDDRWTPTTSAIKRFVSAKESAGIGIGLQYFPLGKDDDEKCEAKTYAEPAVPVAVLPGNAKAMIESIDAHYFTKDNCCDAPEHDGTPTRPAIEGVYQYLQGWLQTHPERDAIVLLATDGEPSSVCDDNKIDAVSAVIDQAAKRTPSLRTYVIGIGHEDELEELAKAGGTGQGAFGVDATGAMTEVQLLDALAKIRGATLRCDFEIPSGTNSDPGNINVQRGAGAKATSTLVKVPNAGDCSKASAGGWYYDDASKHIQLCPDACREVLAETKAKVNIVVGCAAVLL